MGSGLRWDEDHGRASPRSRRGCSEGLGGDGDGGTGSQELTGEAGKPGKPLGLPASTEVLRPLSC